MFIFSVWYNLYFIIFSSSFVSLEYHCCLNSSSFFQFGLWFVFLGGKLAEVLYWPRFKLKKNICLSYAWSCFLSCILLQNHCYCSSLVDVAIVWWYFARSPWRGNSRHKPRYVRNTWDKIDNGFHFPRLPTTFPQILNVGNLSVALWFNGCQKYVFLNSWIKFYNLTTVI